HRDGEGELAAASQFQPRLLLLLRAVRRLRGDDGQLLDPFATEGET
ncbi:unnamed protein product, partial [Urochloa humidicola]